MSYDKKIRSFTLIELLVVIAIIGILTTMLLPSLSKAREKIKQTVCLNNFKQLSISFSLYLDNNGTSYPYTRKKDNNSNIISWDDLISGYDGRPGMTIAQMKAGYDPSNAQYCRLYQCPMDSVERSHASFVKRSYGINMYKVGDVALRGISGGQNNSLDQSRNMSEITQPSQTILLSENFHRSNRMGVHWGSIAASTHNNISSNNSVDSPVPHGLKFNYLFIDGHARAATYFETKLDVGNPEVNSADSMWDAVK